MKSNRSPSVGGNPEKRTIRIYTITPAGEAEVRRIWAILMPKIEETLQVLQAFIADLHSHAGETDTPKLLTVQHLARVI